MRITIDTRRHRWAIDLSHERASDHQEPPAGSDQPLDAMVHSGNPHPNPAHELDGRRRVGFGGDAA